VNSYLTAYLLACFALCSLCIFKKIFLGSEEDVGVDGLHITKMQLLCIFFLVSVFPFLFQMLFLLASGVRTFKSGEHQVASAISTSIAQLIALAYVLRCKYLRIKKMPFNWLRSLRDSLCEFGVVLPIVTLASDLWLAVLGGLNRCGLPISLDEQAILKLFMDFDGWWQKLLLVATAVLLAPVLEELVFRGGIYRALKLSMGRKFATILTSAIFAVLHFNLVAALPLYVLSVLLIKNYERSGDISVPVLVHAAFNLNSFAVIALCTMPS
jgi:membrane protease YdiL (CAAX protease family)